DDSRLTRRDAIFGVSEADPLAIALRRDRGGEGAYLDADGALVLPNPVPIGDPHRLDRQRAAWADHDPPLARLDAHDVERLLLSADLDSPALTDGEMHHAAVMAEDSAIEVDDVAGRLGLRSQALHQPGIIAVG